MNKTFNGIPPAALRIAKVAAVKAGKNALRYFGGMQSLRKKTGSQDELTQVDIKNNKLIVDLLRKNFPNHSILSEETKPSKEISKYFWLVDPLDGTISYSFGLSYWGIAISLLQDNDPILGVIYIPALDKLYWAMKGKGTFLNSKRLKVSDLRSLEKGIVAIDYGYASERKKGVEEMTQKIADKVRYPLTYGCVPWSQALIAEGKIVAHLHHMARRFDHAAGSVLVSEAGGKVTDIQGNLINWRETVPVHLVATNGWIHTELLSLLKTPHH